ncbi:hypothetical protein B0H10DRAFT_1949697 [Mycena sp. CBHHK59/15]|nr:hypothetical protein B0H10DRAFT_1962045 [Mycena sp. CBHHK59/15]KAJ6615680.1 hypothetical protein B0H10DRAFT_1949697 [Mycena sp. CBHHK59/15]
MSTSTADPPETQRYCAPCARILKFGKGGVANFEKHLNSPEHLAKEKTAKSAGSSKQITSFFTQWPRAPPPPDPPATASAAAHPHTKSASGFIIDVDELPDSSGSVPPLVPLPGEDLGEILLSRLQAVISTLPSSVPAAQNGDLISTFAVDPTTLILPGQDAWEDVIHGLFNCLLLNGAHHKNTVELSGVIRRGPLGMNGFFSWLEICFNQLHISPAMVENRVERIIQAMMLLGSTVSPPSPPTPTNSVARKDTPATVTTIAILGCPGQELLTESDRSSFLSYPLGAHADRQLPWSIEFGDSLVVRSKECKRHTQLAGICFPCERLLHHGVVKGILHRDENGPHVNTPFAYLTMGDMQKQLKLKNTQINNLKLTGLTALCGT